MIRNLNRIIRIILEKLELCDSGMVGILACVLSAFAWVEDMLLLGGSVASCGGTKGISAVYDLLALNSVSW